jgi:hypothetical protein
MTPPQKMFVTIGAVLFVVLMIIAGCDSPTQSNSYDYAWMIKPGVKFTLFTEGQVLQDCTWIDDYHCRCGGKRVRLLGSGVHYALVEEPDKTKSDENRYDR